MQRLLAGRHLPRIAIQSQLILFGRESLVSHKFSTHTLVKNAPSLPSGNEFLSCSVDGAIVRGARLQPIASFSGNKIVQEIKDHLQAQCCRIVC